MSFKGFNNSVLIWPEILSYPLTTLPAPFVIWILSTQVPGVNDKPYACEAPRTDGTFSSVIIKYGLVSPSILICFVPVKASEKLTSIDGFVSKLSARLQHAALSNSLLVMSEVFPVTVKDF